MPFRNSKLTRILQQSLSGNSKTTLVICVSPTEANESETKSTLHFGSRAKRLRTEIRRNLMTRTTQWKKLYEKEHEGVALLKSIVNQLESEVTRWRRGESIPDSDWFTREKYAGLVNDIFNSSASVSSLKLLNRI